jgi:hypothetical protein
MQGPSPSINGARGEGTLGGPVPGAAPVAAPRLCSSASLRSLRRRLLLCGRPHVLGAPGKKQRVTARVARAMKHSLVNARQISCGTANWVRRALTFGRRLNPRPLISFLSTLSRVRVCMGLHHPHPCPSHLLTAVCAIGWAPSPPRHPLAPKTDWDEGECHRADCKAGWAGWSTPRLLQVSRTRPHACVHSRCVCAVLPRSAPRRTFPCRGACAPVAVERRAVRINFAEAQHR